MTSAVVNDTIESDEVVNASVVSEQNGKSRLVQQARKLDIHIVKIY